MLTFVGHYQDGNEVNFDDPVGLIIASEQIPADHLSPGGCLELSVGAHDYPLRVESFVAELDDRRSEATPQRPAEQDGAGQAPTAPESK